MNKLILARFIIFIYLVLSPIASLFADNESQPVKVCVKEVCLLAEVASTQAKREQGLMFRQKLADNQGMLFIFETEQAHSFWMKNMSIPLDIIWIDSDKKIVDIKKNLLPCKSQDCLSYSPKLSAKYVLEVNAGFSQKHLINIGDKVSF